MERKKEGENPLLHALNFEIYATLSGWKLSPYSEMYATELQTLLEVAKKGDLITTLKIKKSALRNPDNFIRIIPQELTRFPIKNHNEGKFVIFEIDPFSEQTKDGRDPYILCPYADISTRQSCLSIYHMNHGGVASFLLTDIEAIHVSDKHTSEK